MCLFEGKSDKTIAKNNNNKPNICKTKTKSNQNLDPLLFFSLSLIFSSFRSKLHSSASLLLTFTFNVSRRPTTTTTKLNATLKPLARLLFIEGAKFQLQLQRA